MCRVSGSLKARWASAVRQVKDANKSSGYLCYWWTCWQCVIAVRLAQFGYRVTLLKNRRLRVCVCETTRYFPPQEMAGVRDQIDTAGFPLTHRVVLRWGKAALEGKPWKPGLLVDRTLWWPLRESARSAGVQVLCPAMADKPYRRDNGPGTFRCAVRRADLKRRLRSWWMPVENAVYPARFRLTHAQNSLSMCPRAGPCTRKLSNPYRGPTRRLVLGAPMPEGRFASVLLIRKPYASEAGRAAGAVYWPMNWRTARYSARYWQYQPFKRLCLWCKSSIFGQSPSPDLPLCGAMRLLSMDPLLVTGRPVCDHECLVGAIIVHTLPNPTQWLRGGTGLSATTRVHPCGITTSVDPG